MSCWRPERSSRRRAACLALAVFAVARADGDRASGSDVSISGCEAERVPSECTLGAGSNIRIVLPSERWNVRASASVVERRGAPRDDASQLVDVTIDDRTASVPLTVVDPSGTTRRSFTLVRRASPSWAAEVARLRAEGKLGEAATRLRKVLASSAGEDELRARDQLARVELAAGHVSVAKDELRKAQAVARAQHATSSIVRDGFALTYAAIYDGRRLDDARAELVGVAADVAHYPDGAAEAPYYEGLIAYELGDLRGALRGFDAATRRSERLGLVDLHHRIAPARADVLQLLGRNDEAGASLRAVLADPRDREEGCARAHLLTNLGWFHLQESLRPATAPRPRASAALEPLERAVAMYRARCPSPPMLRNALVNVALAHALAGSVDLADAALTEANAGPALDPRVAVWQLDVAARVALARGRSDVAERAYREMAAIAARTSLPGALWRASVGLAESIETRGDLAAAAALYLAAEKLVDDQLERIPLGEGREGFAKEHGWGARLAVDCLVRLGDHARAFEVVRRSLRRVLATLSLRERVSALGAETRDRWELAVLRYRRAMDALGGRTEEAWTLPADERVRVGEQLEVETRAARGLLDDALGVLGEPLAATALPPLPGDQLALAFFPVRDGYVGFAALGPDVRSVTLGAVDTGAPRDDLARRLLLPFAPAIRSASRIRLFVHGSLANVDLHALPLDGAPLYAKAPVLYALDLPDRPPHGQAAPSVVVTDPRLDLPAARNEGQAVVSALRAGSGDVIELYGHAATTAALRAAMWHASHLHFAGHAAAGGPDGRDGVLSLASSSELGVADVLTAPGVPESVFLSACDGARVSPFAEGQGLGVAQAFIVAGARFVIAATRPVSDDTSAVLARHLYSSRFASNDLAMALREALLRATDDGIDASAFRLLAR